MDNKETRYLNISDKDFIKVVDLFLKGKAYIIEQDGNILFGITDDKYKYTTSVVNGAFIIITQSYSCNMIVLDNEVVTMSIFRGGKYENKS